MTGSASISVVVCAHTMDRVDTLCATICSLQVQTRPALELIVVCDHNAELRSYVASKFPDVVVVENTGRKGLSGARNTGVDQSRGDIIAFLDDDAVADKSWLEYLLLAYDDPSVMAVGGTIRPTWPDRRPRWFPREFDWVIGCSYLGLPDTPSPVRNPIGCNMSLRKEILDVVGGFREELGRDADDASGCEETELFIRAHEAFPGHIVLYEPKARVEHVITPSRTKWSYFRKRCHAEGRSKADMVRTVGAGRGLSSESSYTFKTLPAGVFRGLHEAARGDISGLLRSCSISLGFAFVLFSYLSARLKRRLSGKVPPSSTFRPILIVDADIDERLPDLPLHDPATGERYGGAWCLIRSGGQPIKTVQFPFADLAVNSACFQAIVENDPEPIPATRARADLGPQPSKVTVVIATRDRAESLARCLDSLLEQTYQTMEIVVVDNAPSSPATADLVAEKYAQTGRVRYAVEDIPGLARAHNTGVLHATGDVIAFTDDDVIVDPAWVDAIARNFAQSDRVGCVTGLILPAELATRAQHWTEGHGGFGKGFERRIFDTDQNRPKDPLFPYTAGAFGSGANMAFSRKALEQLGGFDGALGAGTPAKGGDDLASFVAAIEAGFQLVYEPEAIVWHHHRRSDIGMRRQAYGYGVGLGAYLTKQITDNPSKVLHFASCLPAAMAHLFSSKSEKMRRLPSDYPRGLVWKERFGILMGVPGYMRSKFQMRATPPRHDRNTVLMSRSQS